MAKRMGVVLAVALLAACGDDNDGGTSDGGNNPTKSAGPGLGLSKAAPEGPTFTLPTGLTLETPILAYSPDDPVDCDEKYPEEDKANGSAVTLCLAFRNTTNAPITLTLPPGLLFVSSSDKVQSGLLVQTATIEVPPGERFVSPLFLHCANQDRNTSRLGDRYALGPVVQYDEFQEFYALIAGKKIS